MHDFEVHPVGTGQQPAKPVNGSRGEPVAHITDMARMTARALRAEGKLADLGRMLDEYRDGNRPLPNYADLARLLQG